MASKQPSKDSMSLGQFDASAIKITDEDLKDFW
jgi:hypothetical protein